jgi:SAM-dependent methyltransferase
MQLSMKLSSGGVRVSCGVPMPAHNCPLCGAGEIAVFLRRRGVPAHQNVICDSEHAALSIARGDIDLCCCEGCGFVFNGAFDSNKISYGAEYDNNQNCSGHFDAYVDQLVRRIVEEHSVRNSRIVEVGCGKGIFLRRLIEFPGCGNRGVGFDTSYEGVEQDLDGRLRFQRRHYDADCANVPADVVICRHVIEHVQDPVALLTAIRQAVASVPNARLFLETPCVEWILRNQVIWDVFYEHCSYFSQASLHFALELSGFAVQQISHIFGGQYLWAEAVANGSTTAPRTYDGDVTALAKHFGSVEATLVAETRRHIDRLSSAGPVAIWGAGAKGVTLANLVDADRRSIDCVVDVNPNKQGRYLAGTAHPIVAPARLATRGVESALIMNPNYLDENRLILARLGAPVELVDPMRRLFEAHP